MIKASAWAVRALGLNPRLRQASGVDTGLFCQLLVYHHVYDLHRSNAEVKHESPTAVTTLFLKPNKAPTLYLVKNW